MENELDHINLINTLKERINLLEEKVVDLTGQKNVRNNISFSLCFR